MSVLQRFGEVHKSDQDGRKYRALKLDNGLHVLLVQDIDQGHMDVDEDGASQAGSDDSGDDHDSSCWSTDSDSDSDASGSSSDGGSGSDDDDMGDGHSSSSSSSSSSRHSRRRRHRKASSARDAQGQLSAVALCVQAGHFQEPDHVQGLAHFLEHMVFMGSSKYPDENDFDAFVTQHGGATNAQTDCEQTVFQFQVRRSKLAPTLDRFAQFFIAPLMLDSSTERELENVDSEFEMSREDDDCRLERLLGIAATPGHPLARFLWGNRASLSVECDVRAELFKLYEENYLAERMHVCIVSRHDLDHLEALACTAFGALRRAATAELAVQPSVASLPYEPVEQWNRLTYVRGTKDRHLLELTWALPPQTRAWRCKPTVMLTDMLGDEGPGSLVSLLRNRGLASALVAGNDDTGTDSNSVSFIFRCGITLTDSGLAHAPYVAALVLRYLAMVRRECTPDDIRRFWDEQKALAAISFRFAELEEPVDFAEEVVHRMALYPPEHWVDGEALYFDYDASAVDALLSQLTAARVRVVLMSKHASVSRRCTLTEPYFGTAYTTESLDDTWRSAFALAEDPSSPLPDQLHIPHPNEFIAHDFALLQSPQEGRMVCLVETAQSRLWHLHSIEHNLPRAHANFHVGVAALFDSRRDIVALQAFVELVSLEVKEVTYMAQMADLNTSIRSHPTGLVLKVDGLSDKLDRLFAVVVRHLAAPPVFTNERFTLVKQQMARRFRNSGLKAERHARNLRLRVLRTGSPLGREMLEYAEALSLDEVARVHGLLRAGFTVDALVVGNVSAERARAMHTLLVETLTPSSAAAAAASVSVERAQQTCRMLCADERLFVVEPSTNETDDNCCLEMYYQLALGDSRLQDSVVASGLDEAVTSALEGLDVVTAQRVLHETALELLEFVMAEPCFDVLRTKESLGYDVECSYRSTDGACGYSLSISAQSAKYSMQHLHERASAFLTDFRSQLANEWDDAFIQKHAASLAVLKRQPDVTLSETADRHFGVVEDGESMFDKRARQAALLDVLGRAETLAVFDAVIAGGRELHVCVMGRSHRTQTDAVARSLVAYLPGSQRLTLETSESAREGVARFPPVSRHAVQQLQ